MILIINLKTRLLHDLNKRIFRLQIKAKLRLMLRYWGCSFAQLFQVTCERRHIRLNDALMFGDWRLFHCRHVQICVCFDMYVRFWSSCCALQTAAALLWNGLYFKSHFGRWFDWRKDTEGKQKHQPVNRPDVKLASPEMKRCYSRIQLKLNKPSSVSCRFHSPILLLTYTHKDIYCVKITTYLSSALPWVFQCFSMVLKGACFDDRHWRDRPVLHEQ